mmetsp:Transcript_26796/g.48413  ORF Transcript_26796/g.48413 Transcript_26796/m.48413 type:complete len:514 (+) Transcript_26796:91-1632(+)
MKRIRLVTALGTVLCFLDPGRAVRPEAGQQLGAEVHYLNLLPSAKEASHGSPHASESHPSQAQQAGHGSQGHAQPEEGQHETLHSNIGIGASLVLLGMVLFVMCLFCLVNYPNESLQRSTWNTLSDSISIILAILTTRVIHDIVMLICVELLHQPPTAIAAIVEEEEQHAAIADRSGRPSHHHHSMALIDVVRSCWRFLVFFVGVETLLFKLKKDTFNLAAVGTVGAHLVGFSAADAFSTLMELPLFSRTLGSCFLADIIAIACMGFLCVGASVVRTRIVYLDGKVDKEEEDWLHYCEEVENEFCAFGIGLGNTQVIRMAITGEVLPYEGVQQNNNPDQVGQMMMSSLICVALVPLLFALQGLFPAEWKRKFARLNELLEKTISMTAGWALLLASRWLWWYKTDNLGILEGDVMLSQFVIALFWSVLGSLIMAYIEENRGGSLDDLQEAFILLIALSWETTFHTAVSEISHWRSATEKGLKVRNLVIGFSFTFAIGCSWYNHVLPKSLHLQRH